MLRKEETTVKVCIKLRSSDSCCSSSHWLVKEGRSIQLANSHAEPNVFVYVLDVANQEVFDRMAQEIICKSLQGFNGTMLAFSPSMMGDGKNPGLIVIGAKKIFHEIHEDGHQTNLDPKQIIESPKSDRTDDDAVIQSLLKEGAHISKSLSNAVKHLSDNQPGKNTYFSFRDCKLTRFLQTSLCGNCFTSIICLEQSQSTLNFASRAREIRIDPQVKKMEREMTTIVKRVDSEIEKLRDQLADEKQKKDNKLKVQILESKLVAEKLEIISRQPLDAVRRWEASTSIKSESSKLDFDFLAGPPLDLAHNTKSTDAADDLPTINSYKQKCADLQAEVSALTAYLKSLNVNMETQLALDLEHNFNSHKAQLEIHLLTGFNGGDLTTNEELKRSFNNLSRLVVRIENMQADFLAIQQKYHSLQEKYKSLELSSQASEEECLQLQAENKSLWLEIGALKERGEEAQRRLLEASSQELKADEFKAKLELVTGQEESAFEGFQSMCECLSNQLSESVNENRELREELRSMKEALVVKTEQGADPHDDLLAQDNALLINQLQFRCEKLTESLKQAEARQEQTISSSEYEKQIKELGESLREAKAELKLKEKQKSDDELENRAKFLESQEETKHQYEREVAKLKETLLLAKEDLSRVTDRCQAEKLELRHENNALKEKLLEAAEKQKQRELAHSMELEKVRRSGLQDQLGQASNERNKAFDELALMRSPHKEEAQLEAVSREHKELQELQQKYDQLAIYTDNQREEKSILQVRIDEAVARHSSTLRKFHQLEMEMCDLSRQKVTEKSHFEEKLETMTAKIGFLKQELKRAASHDDLPSEDEDLKLSLQAKVTSSRDLEVEKLRSDLKLALEAKDAASAQKLALTSKFQAMEERMATQAGKFEKELADLNSSTNEVQLKLKSLESENDQLKVKLKNSHNLQSQLEEEQKLCASLRTQFAELKETKVRLEEQLRNQEVKVDRNLLEKSQEVELCRQTIGKLSKECDQLRCDLQTKTNSFLKERDALVSKNKLLEERLSSLNLNRNTELVTKLRTKEADLESLRETLTTQKFAAEAANVKCRNFMKQEVEFTKEIEQLRNTLKSKEANILAERDALNATNSSLLEDKRNLEERQYTLYERIGKLEEEISALQAFKITKSNSFVESNGLLASQTTMKPLYTNKLDAKKSSRNESAVRRERRKTAHDEHRKQSYWNDSRDFGTMTDPEDCRRATPWNMELMKNPLRAENTQLKTRMLIPQAIIEQRRLSRKIHDLTIRMKNPIEPPQDG